MLKKAHEQPPAAVSKLAREVNPKIAAQAIQEGAEIQWGGQTGLRSENVRGRGYVPKGKTPIVLAHADRAKLSVISTVANKCEMRWKVFSDARSARLLIG